MFTSELEERIYYAFVHLPVYRIDGLKSGPLDLGTYDPSTPASWQQVAHPAIDSRMSMFGAAETHFALLRICQKRSVVLESIIRSLNSQLEASVHVEDGTDSDAASQRNEVTSQIARYNELLQEEQQREARHAAENVRRRHNYVPLIVELLHSLGRAGKLSGIIDSATKAHANRSQSAADEDS
jgi:ubiquitin carboxyl-terminal hydrolase L5